MLYKLKSYLKLSILIFGISIFLVKCQKDDTYNKPQSIKTETLSTRKTVSAKDIPEIMNFIKSKSNSRLEFNFGDVNFAAPGGGAVGGDPHESNLTTTEVNADDIIVVTQDGLSNYAFRMMNNNLDYYLNLIVVEYLDSYYMYFAKYIPSSEVVWDGVSLKTFVGTQYLYSETGIYRKTTHFFSNGYILVPCDCPDNGGGGSSDCYDVTMWKCNFRGQNHSHWSDCNCWNSIPDECTGFTQVTVTTCTQKAGYTIEPPKINTSTEVCYCWVDDGSGGSSSSTGTAGTPDYDCPRAAPCATELELYDANCECYFAIYTIVPINVGAVILAKEINICLGDALISEQVSALDEDSSGAIYTYLIEENNCSSPAKDFTKDFLDIANEFPNAKFKRYKELSVLLENNPWALIQDCAQQNGLAIASYQALYQHTIPQVCKNRLNALGTGYSNQPITEGNVPLANIDYYSVEITTYPDFDNNGFPDTEAEIYQAFRNKFIDLASGEKDNFQFSCDIPFNETNTGYISWDYTIYTSRW